MKIVVAGVSGSLGSFLAKRLVEANHEVIGISRTNPLLPGVQFVAHDLRQPLRSTEFGDALVINAAALTRDGNNAEILLANTQIAANCLRLSQRGQILVSSSSVYDLRKPTINADVSEATGKYPFLNSYSKSKYESELLYRLAEAPSMTLRPHALIGEGDGTLLPRVRRSIRGGKLRLPNGGVAKHEFTSFENFANAVELAIIKFENGWGGNVTLNVSDGQSTSIRDAILHALKPEKIEFESIPVPIAMAVGRLSQALAIGKTEPRISRYAVSQLAFARSYDLSDTIDLLGYEPKLAPAFS